MNQVVFISSLQNEDAKETALQFAADGCHVYGAYTDGAALPCDGLETIVQLVLDPMDAGSLNRAVELVSSREGKLDILVLKAGLHAENDGGLGAHDYDAVADVIYRGADGMRRILEAFLPLLRAGETKRIAVLSESCAGIGFCEDTGEYGYHMAMAALNMMEKIAFNALRPEGFTFRNFVTDGPKTGMDAKTYIQRDLSNHPEDDYIHSDENRLVRRDSLFRELAW